MGCWSGVRRVARRARASAAAAVLCAAFAACGEPAGSAPATTRSTSVNAQPVADPAAPTAQAIAEFAGLTLPPQAQRVHADAAPHAEFGTVYRLRFELPAADAAAWCLAQVNFLHRLVSAEQVQARRRLLGVAEASLEPEAGCASLRDGHYRIQREVLVLYPRPGHALVVAGAYRMPR